jgi:hypothetical protein
MSVLAHSAGCGDEDVSGPKCPRFPALFEREPASLNEGNCDIFGRFGLVVAMNAVGGMIKSFNHHRGTIEYWDNPVHRVSEI